ncbi:uncharacterized protein LOC142240052 [Haematobia irritans]|uniref:uncharacterized protein LOC142240052 n=1 Tax=Haematobia irritans TaxID=7368 RepID=UPI003F50BF6A
MSIFKGCIFAILFVCMTTCYAEFYLKFTKIECDPNPKYFTNHSCRLRAIDRYKTVVSMKTLIKDVLRNVSVNLALFARNDVNAYRPFLINVTQNVCSFLDKKKSMFYMNAFMKFMTAYTNINHSCPFDGYVFADDLYFDKSHDAIASILTAWSQTRYKLVTTFYEGYPLENIGNVAVYIDVIETRKPRRYNN